MKTFMAALALLLSWNVFGFCQAVPGYGSSVTEASSHLSSYEYLVIDGQPVYIYTSDSGITPPKPTHEPKPKYSKEAKKAKLEGTCTLWLIVGTDGLTHRVKVIQPLGKELDEQALAAVQKWRFNPAQKDGHPVAVAIRVQVNFKLH